MAAPSAPSTKGNTVALTLVAGESANPTATFSQAMAARMITVGSGPSAHWKIRAQGVDPLHAELYWDGSVLWARNGGSLGGTYVAGQRADEWTQLFDGSELLLGRARVTAKVAGPDARNPAGTNPNITARGASYIDEEESTVVFSNQSLLKAVQSATPSQPPGPAPGAAPRTARVGTMAPPQPAQMAPVAQTQEPQKPPAAEATVIRQSPYAALEAAGMAGPLPAAGNRNPMPGENRTIAPGSLQVGSSSVVLSASAVSLPVVGPHTGAMPQPVSATLQAFQPTNQMGSNPPSSPGYGASQPGDDPFGPIDMPPPAAAAPAEKTVAGTSPRTLVLAGITLVIGLIAAILPPPAQQRANRAAQGPTAEVQTVGASPPLTNNILMLPISEPGIVGVIVPAAIPMVDAQGRPRPPPPPNPQDPIKLAAEAVAANRYADAVLLYERLAVEHPEAPLFRQFATVLRARVAQMNCPPGAPGCTLDPPPAAAPAPSSPPSAAR